METALKVGLTRQLLVDDAVVERVEGLRKALNHPVKHPGNPILWADRPWEVSTWVPNVLYDESTRLFRMWYQTRSTPLSSTSRGSAT